jgi:hypothetical protein
MTLHSPSFYFEVNVIHCVQKRCVFICPSVKQYAQELRLTSYSVFGIGVCEDFSSLVGMPGWGKKSWGYHSNDGKLFSESGWGTAYGETYQTGDVIGCGGDIRQKNIFFTKNGVHLGEYMN